MKKALAVLTLLALAVVWFFSLRPRSPDVREALANSASASVPNASRARAPAELEPLDLAKDLNAPDKTIRDDLRALDAVFSVWRTNFLSEGNPVGDNGEITSALTGRNRLHLAFLAPDHPAINRRGELCDRWGTPFFFHQLSGTQMEIRSAGPDRVRGTADDVSFTAQ